MGSFFKRLLWTLMKWGWLLFLKIIVPRYWPQFLRQELQGRLQAPMGRLAELAGRYQVDHWTMLRSQLPGDCQRYSLHAIGDIWRLTKFRIRTWGITYTVYVEDGTGLASPKPPVGTTCLSQAEMEGVVDAVYKLVDDAHDELLRRRREAERQERLKVQRHAWLAEEKKTAEPLDPSFRAKLKEILTSLARHKATLEKTRQRLTDGMSKIRECDDGIAKWTQEIMKFARAAEPIMNEIELLEGKICARVATLAESKEVTPAKMSVAEMHRVYSERCSKLLKIEAKVQDLQGQRAAAYQARTAIRQRLQTILATSLAPGPLIQEESRKLNEALAAVENDRAVDAEWQRVESKVRSAQNDWTATKALLASGGFWHLTKVGQSRAKAELAAEARSTANAIIGRCQELVNTIKKFTPPATKPEEIP